MKYIKKSHGVYMRTDGLHVTKIIDFDQYTEITHETLSCDRSVSRFSRTFTEEITENEFIEAFERALSKLHLLVTI